MADFIDLAHAKELLGCDDATLNGYINNNSIRSQRVDGKIMVLVEDVERFAHDDGTIVITGDSDELRIDSNKTNDAPKKKDGTQSITFGDDLEVVSFDDTHTNDLKHNAPKSRTAGSFSESHTEIMSAVDEAPVELTTDVTRASERSASAANDSARRSVRSNRAYVEAPKIAAGWVVVLALTLIVCAGFILPYYFIAKMPHGADAKDYAGNVLRGTDDNFMTDMASTCAGFAVEPDKDRFKKSRGNDATGWIDIKDQDRQATWRTAAYLGTRTKSGEKRDSVTIVKVTLDENQVPSEATTKLGDVYKVVPVKTGSSAGEITTYKVDMSNSSGKSDVSASPAK